MNGGVTNMNTIANALEQIRMEIQQLQGYLSELREAERQLAKLEMTRQIVLGAIQTQESVPSPTVQPQESPAESETSHKQLPLPFDILKILSTAGQTVSLVEIRQEIEKIRGPIKKNALSSTLSRLVQERRIRRPKPGKYAVIALRDVSDEAATLRRDSIPGIAYDILREVGKPLTVDEIWPLAKAVKPDLKRHSLMGSLYGNAKIKRIFILMGEKTFGLREWQNRRGEHQQEALANREVVQPAEAFVFGESREGRSTAEERHLSAQTE